MVNLLKNMMERAAISGRGSPSLLASVLCFSSSSEDRLYSYVFPLVVLLVKGKRLGLGSLYARLDEC